MLATLGPRLDEIDAELTALTELRDQPAGTIRLTSGEHAVDTVLIPVLAGFLARYPDIKVEIISDYARADIVADRTAAGDEAAGAGGTALELPGGQGDITRTRAAGRARHGPDSA